MGALAALGLVSPSAVVFLFEWDRVLWPSPLVPYLPLLAVWTTLSCCVVVQVQVSYAPRGSPRRRTLAPRCRSLSKSLHANLPATESVLSAYKGALLRPGAVEIGNLRFLLADGARV